MSNSFPPVPTDFDLLAITYTLTGLPSAGTGNIAYTFTGGYVGGVNNGVGPDSGSGNPSVQFVFDTPGSFGTFDQTDVEVVVTALFNDFCQTAADSVGQTLAEVQIACAVERQWTWNDPAGYVLYYTDTAMTL